MVFQLYRIEWEGEDYYVEAPSMPAAITAWRDSADLEGEDEEPDTISLVSALPAIRFEPREEEPRRDEP